MTEQTPDPTQVTESGIDVEDEPTVTAGDDPDATTTHAEDDGNPDDLAGEEVDDDDLDDDEAEDTQAGDG